MDDSITAAVSRVSARDLPKLASSTTEPLYLHKIASASLKILKADQTAHTKSCARDLFDTLQALLASCCKPAVSACIEPFCTVMDLMIEYSVHRDYFRQAVFAGQQQVQPVYDFMVKAMRCRDRAVGDAAIRTCFVLADVDRVDVEGNADQLVGPLVELVMCDEALWQGGVSALTAIYRAHSRHARSLILLLKEIYENAEGLPVEELTTQVLSVLDNHEALKESGVFAMFCEQCEREQLHKCLGDALDGVVKAFGHGSPLYEDIVAAQRTRLYMEYVCLELQRVDCGEDEVMELVEGTKDILEGWHDLQVAREAGLRAAVESAVCRLALYEEMPVVDKRIRLAARAILSLL